MKNDNLPAVIQTAITEQHIDLSQVNLILPTKTFARELSKYEKVSLEIVEIDPDPKRGETHKIEGKLVFGKNALLKLSHAANIKWDTKETGAVKITETSAYAKAAGYLRKPNGQMLPCVGSYHVDCDIIEREQTINYKEKAEKGKPIWKKTQFGKSYLDYVSWESEKEKKEWIELKVEKAVVQSIKHRVTKAETGAINRAIRQALIIHNYYTEQELNIPFVVPCIALDVEEILNDPLTRRDALDNMFSASKAIDSDQKEERNITDESTLIDPENAQGEQVLPYREPPRHKNTTESPQQQEPIEGTQLEFDFGDDIIPEKELVEKLKEEIRTLLSDEDMPIKHREYYTNLLEREGKHNEIPALERTKAHLVEGLEKIKEARQ
jgi:hypothetical protein